MFKIGRRIYYDLNGKIIKDTGEMETNVDEFEHSVFEGISHIDFPFGYESDKFSRAIEYHIDIETKEVVFDKLLDQVQTPQERIEELENQLLLAQEGLL